MIASGEADPVVGIKALAADLIDEAQLDGPPFRPEILASFRNVREVRLKPMQSAARLFPDRATGTLIIEVNEQHSEGKRNFSIDHETIHTVFPTYTGSLIDDLVTGEFSSGSEEELLCDIGAAALLLDDRWLRPIALQSGCCLDTLFYLATRFNASLEATARKLIELQLWPCAFVFWEDGFRKNERIPDGQRPFLELMDHGLPQPQLRVARPYCTRSFDTFIPHNKSIPETSLIATCCDEVERTAGFEAIEFRTGYPERFYCESAFVPYRRNGVVRRRIVSLLVRTKVSSTELTTPELFRLEDL
jgi:hypothetical protein